MLDLSIILLNYNTLDMTLQCLDRITSSDLGKYSVEIVLVDNDSSDGSVNAFKKHHLVKGRRPKTEGNLPKLKLIQNTSNLGFAAGNNRGIRQAKGRYILLLNTDVFVEKDTLKKMIQYMDKENEFDVTTCKLMMPKKNRSSFVMEKLSSTSEEHDRGFTDAHKATNLPAFSLPSLQKRDLVVLDSASHRGEPTLWASFTYFAKLEKILPKTKLFGQYHQGWRDMNKSHEVDAISGGFFFARKKIFDQVGLFDEGFFMYAEDLDLCKRIREAGFKIGFYPKCSALHLKGMSGRKKHENPMNKGSVSSGQRILANSNDLKSKSKSNYYFWHTMKLYYQKHYSDKYPKIIMWGISKAIDWKSK